MIYLQTALSLAVFLVTITFLVRILKKMNDLEAKFSSLILAKREERPEIDLNDRLEMLQRMRFSPAKIVKRLGDEK